MKGFYYRCRPLALGAALLAATSSLAWADRTPTPSLNQPVVVPPDAEVPDVGSSALLLGLSLGGVAGLWMLLRRKR